MVLQQLRSGLGEQDVDLAADGVQGDLVVCGVWREDCDRGTGGQGVDGGFVGLWIDLVVCWVRVEGDVEPVVNFGDVLLQMLFYVLVRWDVLPYPH